MLERPILFSASMVRAILEGRKTVTRRVVTPQFTKLWGQGVRHGEDAYSAHVDISTPDGGQWLHCPYGKAGDYLWVRETWQTHCDQDGIKPSELPHYSYVQYPATYDGWVSKRRPSIFMPRWASRIALEVTGVRVERVQDITEEDAEAEGADKEFRTVAMSPSGCKDYHIPNSYRGGFANLWDEINAKRGYGWDANPWVWVVELRRLEIRAC